MKCFKGLPKAPLASILLPDASHDDRNTELWLSPQLGGHFWSLKPHPDGIAMVSLEPLVLPTSPSEILFLAAFNFASE